MLHDIVEAQAIGDHRLLVKFDDGTMGTLDVGQITRFDGVFAPSWDPACFAQVRVDPELGTVVWPSGADLCPDVLYARLTGEPLPGTAPETVAS
jgi:hypothetical protein